MMTRTAIVLLLLLPPAAFTQDLDTAASAVVQISGIRNGATVRGSGFVVGLDRDKAMIVTVSHVIAGLENIQVTFAADLTESFPAGGFLRMDAESPNGPAVLQVRGSLPAGVTVLNFEVEKRPRLGEPLYLQGFPLMATSLRTTQRTLSARDGTALLIDQGLGEGFSGGPVIQYGKVVGVVTGVDDQTTYAVEAVVVLAALGGWGVKLEPRTTLGTSSPNSPPPPPNDQPAKRPVVQCVPGEKRTIKGMFYLRICPGTFTMGSTASDPSIETDETPAHQVTIGKEFWLGQAEVTNAQYRRIYPHHDGETWLPAVGMTWIEAQAACKQFGGRLPTEAEWEYAARAGSSTPWSFGVDEQTLGNYAWFANNAGGTPHLVATKKPNPWGLYDMHGNVSEWVADWYSRYTIAAQSDPTGPTSGGSRVVRGGAYNYPSRYQRSADRLSFQPGSRVQIVGFRCALSSN